NSALRKANDREQLTRECFMLLAERVRKAEERLNVKQVIEKQMKVKINEADLYNLQLSKIGQSLTSKAEASGIVLTKAMSRLFILVSNAIQNNEPVLLVGETGCGKTTVCQVLAETFRKNLY